MRQPSLTAKLGAEFLGTFVLVFGGCGAAVLAAKFLTEDSVQLGIGFVGVSLAFGLAVLAGAHAFGHVSGGHFNPAVTIGLAIAKRFQWKGVLPYIVIQLVSASVAGAVLFAIANGKAGFSAVESGFASNGYGAHSPGGYGLLSGLIVEIVITAVFVYIILGSTDDRAPKGLAPDRDRPGLDVGQSRSHSSDELLSESGTLAGRRVVRRTGRAWSGVVVLRCADHWRGDRRCDVCAHHRGSQCRCRCRPGSRGGEPPTRDGLNSAADLTVHRLLALRIMCS